MRTFLIILGIVVLLVIARLSVFTVGPTEYVYLTQFGEPIDTFDGNNLDEAGLHFCLPWPIQSVYRLDRRLQYFDLPSTEVLTKDQNTDELQGNDPKKSKIGYMLIVEAYVCWKIADEEAVDTFIRKVGSVERAKDFLGQDINSKIGAEFGNTSMEDLISTDADQAQKNLERFYSRVKNDLASFFREEYGVELVDIRLRRFYHPEQVRESVFALIRSERNKKAEEHRSEGETLAEKIREDAKFEANKKIIAAKEYEKETKKKADAEAQRILNEAYAQDDTPGKMFSRNYKKIVSQKMVLGNPNTFLKLSLPHPFFDMIDRLPSGSLANPPVVSGGPDKSGKTVKTNELNSPTGGQ